MFYNVGDLVYFKSFVDNNIYNATILGEDLNDDENFSLVLDTSNSPNIPETSILTEEAFKVLCKHCTTSITEQAIGRFVLWIKEDEICNPEKEIGGM